MRLATLLGAATLGILIAGGSAGTAAAGDRGDYIGASRGGIMNVGAWHGDRSPGRAWRGDVRRQDVNWKDKHWRRHRGGDGHRHWRGRDRDRWSRNGWRSGRRYSYAQPYFGNRYYNGYNYNGYNGGYYNGFNGGPYVGGPYYDRPYYGSNYGWGWNRPGCD